MRAREIPKSKETPPQEYRIPEMENQISGNDGKPLKQARDTREKNNGSRTEGSEMGGGMEGWRDRAWELP